MQNFFSQMICKCDMVAKNIRLWHRVSSLSVPMGKSVVNTTMGPPIAQKLTIETFSVGHASTMETRPVDIHTTTVE